MFCACAITTRLATLRSPLFPFRSPPSLHTALRHSLQTPRQRRTISNQAAHVQLREANNVEQSAADPAVLSERAHTLESQNQENGPELTKPPTKKKEKKPKLLSKPMAKTNTLKSTASPGGKAEKLPNPKLKNNSLEPPVARARKRPGRKPKPKNLAKSSTHQFNQDTIPSLTQPEEIAPYLHTAYVAQRTRNAQGGALVDWKRHHVVSKQLCDDIIERMRPSLAKHYGCDIIDINPGPGLFSSAIHDILRPRTHILMEPEHELYQPILQPLLDAEGSTYKFLPTSGVEWSTLNPILTPKYLPHQRELLPGDPRHDEQNNTLLVIANFAYYPTKSFQAFSSVTHLLLYQLLEASRAQTSFHKYGIVRMLVWVSDIEKISGFARVLGKRFKSSLMAEVTTEYCEEIASSTRTSANQLCHREHSIDIASTLAAMKRMKAAGLTTPRHRMGHLELEATEAYADPKDLGAVRMNQNMRELQMLEVKFANGDFKMFQNEAEVEKSFVRRTSRYSSYINPEYIRWINLNHYKKRSEKKGEGFGIMFGGKVLAEFKALSARWEAGNLSKYTIPRDQIPKKSRNAFLNGVSNTYGGVGRAFHTPEFARLWELRKRKRASEKGQHFQEKLLKEMLELIEKQKELMGMEGESAKTLREEITQRLAIWHEQAATISAQQRLVFFMHLDNYTTFHRERPVLLWDRRKAEPLKVYPEEFYPRRDLALLDIQPKPIWPILRKDFPANLELLEFFQRSFTQSSLRTVKQALSALAPGAYEYLSKACPSLTDPRKGGNIDLSTMHARTLTDEHYKDLVEAWSSWLFKPSRYEVLQRSGAELETWGEDEPLREDIEEDEVAEFVTDS